MVYLNRIELAGNLTADPLMKYTPTGAAITTFTIAHQHNFKDGSGNPKQEVGFYNIVAWKRSAELCNEFLQKGSNVLVIGRLSNRQWTGQDGEKQYRTEIVVNQVIFLDRKSEKVVADVAPEVENGNEYLDEKEIQF